MVGRWMSEEEYNKMLSTKQVQMSGDNKVHVANPADIDAFSKQALNELRIGKQKVMENIK